MPDTRHHDEEAKDKNLQDEAAQDDVLTAFHAALAIRLGQHPRASSLDKEAENVTGHKDLGNPVCANDGQGCRVSSHNEAS